MKRNKMLLVGTLLAAALAGCTLPQDQSPPAQTYLLAVETFAPTPARRASGKTLLVAPPKAAPGFDSNRIAFTRQPPKLDYYRDSVWSDAPARMLLPILVRAFVPVLAEHVTSLRAEGDE